MTLRFNPALYPLPAIERTAKAFEALAEVRIRRRKGTIEVTFRRVKPEVQDRLADEFSNYALAEAKP